MQAISSITCFVGLIPAFHLEIFLLSASYLPRFVFGKTYFCRVFATALRKEESRRIMESQNVTKLIKPISQITSVFIIYMLYISPFINLQVNNMCVYMRVRRSLKFIELRYYRYINLIFIFYDDNYYINFVIKHYILIASFDFA